MFRTFSIHAGVPFSSPPRLAQKSGSIINVASVCGEVSWCGPSYTTSKYAMIGFSKQAAMHYAATGVRINVLAPGAVDTPMLRNGKAEDDPEWLRKKAAFASMIPNGRIADPSAALKTADALVAMVTVSVGLCCFFL